MSLKEKMENTKLRKSIVRARGFAVVVTDKNGMKFVRTMVNGRPSVCLCTGALAPAEMISREVCWFHGREIAGCYGKDTIDLVKVAFRGTKISPVPPFKAEVVPLSFKIG